MAQTQSDIAMKISESQINLFKIKVNRKRKSNLNGQTFLVRELKGAEDFFFIVDETTNEINGKLNKKDCEILA